MMPGTNPIREPQSRVQGRAFRQATSENGGGLRWHLVPTSAAAPINLVTVNRRYRRGILSLTGHTGCAVTFSVVGCGSHGDHRGCDQLWIVPFLRSSSTATCPHCDTTHNTSQLKKLGTSDDWQAVCEIRSRIMAERSAGYDGDYQEDVEHYAVLADRVDQQLTAFHAAGTRRPTYSGTSFASASFDAHTARSGVYTPSGVGLQLPGSVADAIVESAQYDPTSEHEQLLETLADGHLERTHTPVELPEAPDPDDRFPEQGSVRVTPELQSDLTNTVRDVSPLAGRRPPEAPHPLTDACVEAVHAIAEDERRPIASLLSTPDPDAKTGVHHLADEYGIDAGNGTFGRAAVDAARHDHVPEDAHDYLTTCGTGQGTRRHEPRRTPAWSLRAFPSGRCDADPPRRVRHRRVDHAGGPPERRALLRGDRPRDGRRRDDRRR